MTSITAEDVENKDDQPSQIIADCLGTPLVIRKIFKNFDIDQLLELSCVNKLWNYEARSVMRERGNLIAKLECDYECLKAFASDLQQMNVVPFAGVRLLVDAGRGTQKSCQQPSSTALPDQPLILDRLSRKYFACTVNGHWVKGKSQWILLVKNILEDFSGSLQEMYMSVFYERNEVIEQVLQEYSFPRLKILTFFYNKIDTEDVSDMCFLKTLVSHAPTLEELRSYSSLSSLARVLEGSSARRLYSVWEYGDEVPESIMDLLRLESMTLQYTSEGFDVQGFNRITPKLLQISCNTLKSMQMLDAVLAVPLMCYGICLKNVTSLIMGVDFRKLQFLQPLALRLAKNFDFTRIFPRLNEVMMVCVDQSYGIDLDDINALIEPANFVLNEPRPDRAANIKHLVAYLQDYAVQFLAEMFPDTEKLSVKERQICHSKFADIPFARIWTHWVDLKELDLSFSHGLMGLRGIENLDSVFCGIFPKEVAELRKKDEEYLKRVNIVPAMPSITLLKNLRLIKVHCGDVNFVQPDDPKCIFSKVTKFLAFERCPELVSVTLHTDGGGLKVRPMDSHVYVVYSSP